MTGQLDLFEFVQLQAERQSAPAPMPEIRNAQGQRSAVLTRLRSGPLSTFDAERIVHRGQATIGQLRNDGHRIDSVNLDGVDQYVYRGHSPTIKVVKTMQAAYYETSHWCRTAADRKDFDHRSCCQCGSAELLQTHHWRYNLFAESVEFDLITLCRECHLRLHESIKGSCVHFPRRIDTALAARIEAGG